MSEQDEKASYIDILEEELKRAEEEIATLRMQEEHDWIDQRHELALAFDELRTLKRNELADRLIAEMFAEDEKVERDHELAWYMEWNRNLEAQGAFLESEMDVMQLAFDHELANHMDYAGGQNEFRSKLISIIKRYIAHFDKHPNNYMSEELNRITRDAKGVLGR